MSSVVFNNLDNNNAAMSSYLLNYTTRYALYKISKISSVAVIRGKFDHLYNNHTVHLFEELSYFFPCLATPIY